MTHLDPIRNTCALDVHLCKFHNFCWKAITRKEGTKKGRKEGRENPVAWKFSLVNKIFLIQSYGGSAPIIKPHQNDSNNPESFYETVSPCYQSQAKISQKRKLHTNIPHEHRFKNFQKEY